MNKTTEALKLAEEALLGSGYYDTTQQRKALAAILEALAEQEKQEPVATVDANDDGYWADILPDRDVKVGQLLYAAPVDAKSIRAEALEEAAKVCRTAQAQGLQSIREAIEAAIMGLK